MKYLSSDEIRKKFVKYFEDQDHEHISSSSLIPEGKDLLFTNAGMNQFKDIFLGLKKPSYKRAVTVQKCFRANDLDQVGRTPRHHTFFEMLGNFSFGDYFKKEAIHYAWDFLTHPDHLGIDKNRLYVTVYDTDDEAYDLWTKIWEKDQKEIGKSKYEFIKKDKENFWEMGSTGPCGPCSEIFYNYGDQDVEIWNLVFTQFDKQSDGSLEKLTNGPFIDTGAGLERLTAVVQGVESNFETDIFMNIFGYVLEEKINVAKVETWRQHNPNNYSDNIKRNEQREKTLQVNLIILEDLIQYLLDHAQQNHIEIKLKKIKETILEKKKAMPSYLKENYYSPLRFEHLNYDSILSSIFELLSKNKCGLLRNVFIGFLYEEFQKDRALREDGENYEQNLAKQKIDRTKKKQDCIALCQLADHARAIAYLLTDRVSFSNDGRGYVAREIFKRICKCLDQIGIGMLSPKASDNQEPYFIPPYLVHSFIESLDLNVHQHFKDCDKNSIFDATLSESRLFYKNKAEDEKKQTVENAFNKEFDKQFKNQTPSIEALGVFAFKCYETYGLSKDDIKTYLREKRVLDQNLDQAFEDAFEKTFKKAQESSRSQSTQKYLTEKDKHLKIFAGQTAEQINGQSSIPANRQAGKLAIKHFMGYETLSIDAEVVKLSDGTQEVTELKTGQNGFAIFNQTPFYAEAGGQLGDQGEIKNLSGKVIAQVMDCQKYEDIHYHAISIKTDKLNINDKVILQVNPQRRRETKKHHTATHLLHAVLRECLKEKIKNKDGKEMTVITQQRGSSVAHNHLRFDFTHSKALTAEEKSKIERQVNQHITNALPVTTKIMPLQEAKKAGALAFFDEKYPDKVRVLTIGNNKESIELCGGTHVTNTNEIQAFVITEEMSISAGVRRINALVGHKAVDYLLKHNKELIDAQREAQIDKDLSQWVKKNKQENKDLQKQVQKLTVSQLAVDIDIDQLIAKATPIEGGRKIQTTLEVSDREHLRQIADKIKNKLGSGIVILFGMATGKEKGSSKCPLVVTVSKDLLGKYNAVTLLREHGKGGGRPDFAQGVQ